MSGFIHGHNGLPVFSIVAFVLLFGIIPVSADMAPNPPEPPPTVVPSESFLPGQERATGGPCKGLFSGMVGGVEFCTQGFDPVPADLMMMTANVTPEPLEVSPNVLDAAIVCDGDGVSGKRVQVLYVHPPETNRYSAYLASFRQWVKDMDDIFNASAAETGGARHVRFVHDSSCLATVLNVQVSSAAMKSSTPFTMWDEVATQGYDQEDRIYLIFADTKAYSLGIANFWGDDSLSASNRNNRGPSYTSSPFNLWGGSNPAHELMHTLGGVNFSAPNSDAAGHCTDEYDRMCYGSAMRYLCTDSSHEQRFDCNHDDYFHTDPAAGSYLAAYWNPANNGFLIGAASLEKTWSGALSTDWSTSGNWTPAGAPTSGENCFIPAGAPRYPVIEAEEVHCYGTLSVASGAQLTIGPTGGFHAGEAILTGTTRVLTDSYFDLDSALLVGSGGLLVLESGNDGMMFYENGSTLNVNGTLQVAGASLIYGQYDSLANLLVNPGGKVKMLEGGQLTVDGTVTNNGTLSQTKTVLQNATTSFLVITATNTITRYVGVDITLGAVGNMGSTTVAIQGNQLCPSALGKLGLTVGRCYTITPTTARTATVTFYYRSAERFGNPAPNAYHFNGATWDVLSSTRGGSGDALFVRATGVSSYSPFALKDPAIPTYTVWLPLIMRE